MIVTPRHIAALLGGAALAALLAACSRPSAQDELLGQVPADTPYVIAAVRPAPADFRERLMAFNATQMDRMVKDWRDMRAALAAQGPGTRGKDLQPVLEVIDALVAELDGHFTPGGMKTLGFSDEGRGVLYGLGVFPATRMEIADPTRVEALIARVEQRSGHAAEQVQTANGPYRRVVLGPVQLIVALRDRQLLAGLLPSDKAQADHWLPLLLGERRPAHSLADGEVLAKLRKAYGFQGYGDGYVDLQAVTRIVSGADTGPQGRAWAALGAPAAPGACQKLAGRIAAGMPRLVMGVPEMGSNGYVMEAMLETSPGVAAQLQALPGKTRLPGMGDSAPRLFAYGMALEPAALREGLKSLLQFVADQGGDCPWVNRQAIAQAQPRLNLVAGPMLGGLKGFYARLDEFTMNPQTMRPDKLSAGVVLAVDDPRGALGLVAAMLNPALMDLQLPMDGSAVAVPAAALPPDVPPVYLAARPGLLAVALGSGGAERASALLAAPAPDRPVLLEVNMDMAAFASRMSDAAGMVADRMEAEGKVAQARQLRLQMMEMRDYAESGLKVQGSLVPEARGLRLRERLSLP